jgi:CDP-diacylglycerol--glycerol-3-phosphate 3-phosphatidyltransferase
MTSGTPITPAFRDRVRAWAVPVALALGRIGMTPNRLTVLGFAGTCVAAIAVAAGSWRLGGILVLVFGIFDMFDGALARATGRVTRFGSFLDSTLDRLGENLVLAGIVVGAARLDFGEAAVFAALAMAVGSMVTYTRAKAEAIGVHGEVGVAPRPERLILLAGGLFLAGVGGELGPASGPIPGGYACAGSCIEAGGVYLMIALGLLIVFSTITVLQRILHVRAQAKED